MKTIGLIGGIASGKSFIAELFRQLGAAIINADETGHRVLMLPEVKAAALQRWGQNVFNSDGELDRRKVAKIVFADSPEGRTELDFLERLTHPLISAKTERQQLELRESGCPLCVLDVPLLLEAGLDKNVDSVVFIDCDFSIRLKRVKERGWTEEDLLRREKMQLSLEEKKKSADAVILNNGKTTMACLHYP
ncbi:MAG: dephospho-CoA kinase [Planctomycetaceae bacterium]|nr:dephospho-CoA kinase [Planctomycetaceae bacterium]